MMESVYAQYRKEFEGDSVELIIVDNNSQDNSVEFLNSEIKKKKYKNVRLIPNAFNNGFGAGNNLGVSKSKGKFVALLNNDTLVKDDGLVRMAGYMESHPHIAILGGQLRNTDGSLQASAGKFYTPWRVVLLLLGLQKYGLLDRSPGEIERVDWVKGGLMMFRREIFEKINGFDEKIFMYTEDMEICYRAKLLGYQTYFYPGVMVLHAEHGSSSRAFAIVNIYKNLLYFYEKHRSRAEYMLVKLLLRTKAKFLIAAGKLTHSSYLTDTYEKALSVL